MVYEILILSTNPAEKINASIWSGDKVPNIVSIKDEAVDLQTLHWKKPEKSLKKTLQFRNIDEIPEYYPPQYQMFRHTNTNIHRNIDDIPEFYPSQYRFNTVNNHVNQVRIEEVPRFQLHIPRIILVAGNVGRNFVKKLIKIENAYEETRYDIFSVLKPGASRDEILNTAIHISKTLSKSDFIILWPNDVSTEEQINLDYYMPKFDGRKVLFFSEPYAKNNSKNDGIYTYNRMLEKEIYYIEEKYPNVKLFDCNYFLRKNNYLGFKHELRGYAKYILAKYVLFCIRFGFGYHAKHPPETLPSSAVEETYIPYTKEQIFQAFEMEHVGKPELVAIEEDEEDDDDGNYFYQARRNTRERSIQTSLEYLNHPSSSVVESNVSKDNPEKKAKRRRRPRRRRNRRQSDEVQENRQLENGC